MGWRILAALMLLTSAWADETCLSTDENPYVLFGDKTSYLFATNRQINTRIHEVAGCEPTAFWLLSRHGSHNPEADQLAGLKKLTDLKNNILANYKNGNFRNSKQRICSADLKLLEQWSSNINATYAGHLTSDGYMTTQERARGWKQMFPALLNDNTHNYLFKFADETKSATTCKAFTEGLFRAQAEIYDIPKENDKNVDQLIRPYKFCPAWSKEVEENSTLSQRQIFESKQEYKEMISNISLRLGFNYDLDKATILQMYDMCRYYKAWIVHHISPWCAAFTKDDLKRLEYAEDLDTYYKYGYGSTLNQKIGCTLVKDMIEFFNKTHVPNGVPQQPKALIQFGDAASIMLLTTALNAHRDPAPITGDNYRLPQAQSRQWTTSTIAPFNADIAAVLYKCTFNGKFQVNEPNQVLLLQNGQPMYLEGCRVGLCDWSKVLNKYRSLIQQCDQSYCSSAMQAKFGVSLAILVVFRYFML